MECNNQIKGGGGATTNRWEITMETTNGDGDGDEDNNRDNYGIQRQQQTQIPMETMMGDNNVDDKWSQQRLTTMKKMTTMEMMTGDND